MQEVVIATVDAAPSLTRMVPNPMTQAVLHCIIEEHIDNAGLHVTCIVKWQLIVISFQS